MRIQDLQVDSSGFPAGPNAARLQRLAPLVEERPEEALPALLEVAETAMAERDFPVALMGLLLAAKAGYQGDRIGLARAAGVRAVECARQVGDLAGEAHAYRLLALIAFEEGRSKDGHDHLLDAIASFEDAGLAAEVPVLMRWYGEHLALLGATAEAKHAFGVAKERFGALGDQAGADGCARDIAALTSH